MPNWSDILGEIKSQQASGQSAIDNVRKKYIKQLSNYTKRNTISYYSGWLSKPGMMQTQIGNEDKNGFMVAIHKLDRSKGLDLILHTPGGALDATESIIDYLRQMFGKDIRAIVPQIAMSAGTIIACSCKEIVMGKQSNLGPIDPQLRGIPALGVVEEFQTAFREMKKDPAKQMVWNPILNKYHPTFLSQCKNAISQGNQLVEKQLIDVMFDGQTNANQSAKKIVKGLNDYSGNKSHGRHLHYDKLAAMGLKLVKLEDDNKLQDLVLTVHHTYMHTLMNTPAYKIIENQKGVAMVKFQTPQQQK